MKMFMAATALAGLIGLPPAAQAGCGCSGGAQTPSTTAAPVSPYYAGSSSYAGGYQPAAPSYQPAKGYQAAPVYSATPRQFAAPYSATPIQAQMPATTGSSSPRPFATRALASNVPSCCANGGSSCCADGGSSCCQGQAGGASAAPPTSLPTTMQLSTSGNSAPPTPSTVPQSNQAPPMPMSMQNAAPATQAAPAAADPHAGHQH